MSHGRFSQGSRVGLSQDSTQPYLSVFAEKSLQISRAGGGGKAADPEVPAGTGGSATAADVTWLGKRKLSSLSHRSTQTRLLKRG